MCELNESFLVLGPVVSLLDNKLYMIVAGSLPTFNPTINVYLVKFRDWIMKQIDPEETY